MAIGTSGNISSAATAVAMTSNYPTLERESDLENTTDEEKGTSTPGSPPSEPVRTVTGWKWVLICAGFYFSGFLYGLDNTIAADIQSAVVETYGDISKLTWLGSGFPLGSIATILTL
jgi:hypothetical protein